MGGESTLRGGSVGSSWPENKNTVNDISLWQPEQQVPSSQTGPGVIGLSLGIWRGSFWEILIASFRTVSELREATVLSEAGYNLRQINTIVLGESKCQKPSPGPFK